MGGGGSLLITKEEKSFREVPDVNVIDTVGAGDSFTATLMAGVLRGWPLSEIHDAATEVAAYVCSCNGATPEWPQKLKNQILLKKNSK
jgi:fructokinase